MERKQLAIGFKKLLPCSYASRDTLQLSFLKNWMEVFVTYNGESIPNCKFTHLPDNFTKTKVFSLYVETLKERNMPIFLLCSFLRVWRKHFSHVKIPKKTRMGVCQICAELKEKRDTAKTIEQKGILLFKFFITNIFFVTNLIYFLLQI